MTNPREKKRQFALFAASNSPPVTSSPKTILDHFDDGDEPTAKRRATSPKLSIPTLRALIVPRPKSTSKPETKNDEIVKKEELRKNGGTEEPRQQPSPSTGTGTLGEEIADSHDEQDESDESDEEQRPSTEPEFSSDELQPELDNSFADDTFHTTISSRPALNALQKHPPPARTPSPEQSSPPPEQQLERYRPQLEPPNDHDSLLLHTQLFTETLHSPHADPLACLYHSTKATITRILYDAVNAFLDGPFKELQFDLAGQEVQHLRECESALQKSVDQIWQAYLDWRHDTEEAERRQREKSDEERRLMREAEKTKPWWEGGDSRRTTAGALLETPSKQLVAHTLDLSSPDFNAARLTPVQALSPLRIRQNQQPPPETPLSALIKKIVRTGFSEALRYAEGALEDELEYDWVDYGRKSVEERMEKGWAGTLKDVGLIGDTVRGMIEGVRGFGGVYKGREKQGEETVGNVVEVAKVREDGGSRVVLNSMPEEGDGPDGEVVGAEAANVVHASDGFDAVEKVAPITLNSPDKTSENEAEKDTVKAQKMSDANGDVDEPVTETEVKQKPRRARRERSQLRF